MNDPYSHKVDTLINELLDKFEPTEVGDHTCKLGTTKVWITNYPYAYGEIHDLNYPELVDLRPSRLTMKRLRKAIPNRGINLEQLRERMGLSPKNNNND